MEYLRLGGDGPSVSRLALGCWALGGHGWGSFDRAAAVAAVGEALDRGVTLFDTADCYGLGASETLLAQTLGGSAREVVVATKGGVRWDERGTTWRDCSPAYIRRALEASLRRLGVEHIPLYYLHWPDGTTPVEEPLRELVRCQEEGKIGRIGLSNHSREDVDRALRVAAISALQFRHSLIDVRQGQDQIDLAASQGLTTAVWGALGQGLLTGKYGADSRFNSDDHRSRSSDFAEERFRRNLQVADVVAHHAQQFGVTPSQLALRWLLDKPGVGVVLFGAKTKEQVVDNLGAAGWSIARDKYAAILESVQTVAGQA